MHLLLYYRQNDNPETTTKTTARPQTTQQSGKQGFWSNRDLLMPDNSSKVQAEKKFQ